MQRAKKEVEKVAEEKDESFDSILCNNLKNKQQYIINPSYQFCERLRFGRFSYKGMNTDIETIMHNNKLELEPVKSEKRGAPSSDSDTDNEIDNFDTDEEADDEEEEDTLENLK